ncbi:hypothetical protein [Amycolatopsis taiwanensis]|uniref:Uncharacterized protein n=1 Tax=Amycolatopsis taiwanensis TaxID=342230 RepID=A0A9W6R676_9PSEU|nr:hypothetical protein [Amycolatopsis taiwanensis]GLY69463.1 hypothetical protein Atai01_60820 [Amycolatopsis taiwanensis]
MGNLVYAETAEVMAVVRLRRGVVGERRRVCHIVPIPDAGPIPHQLRALCGEAIVPGDAEVLNRIAGMPCEACLGASTRQHYRREYHALDREAV